MERGNNSERRTYCIMGLVEVIEAWKEEPIEDILKRMYIQKDMTIREIAEELHISIGTVCNLLRELHINNKEGIANF